MTISVIGKEIRNKIHKIRTFLELNGGGAIRLKTNDWFFWATGGGSNAVLLATNTGVAEVFVTLSRALVLTDKIEALRMCEEIVPCEYEVVSSPWQDTQAFEEIIMREIDNKPIYSDQPLKHEYALPLEFRMLRYQLEPSEVERYRILGREASQAMTEAMEEAEPHWTEFELAARGAKNLWSRGIEPALIMAAGYRRMQLYRHPVSTDNVIGERVMMVFCARKWGLFANLTRFVSFRPLDAREQENLMAVASVEQAAFGATRIGQSHATIYESIRRAYTELGLGEEINKHHQGGMTGYLSREAIARPEHIGYEDLPVLNRSAWAWNPSVSGMKIEDTILFNINETEILTVDSRWPTFDFNGRRCPDILIKT